MRAKILLPVSVAKFFKQTDLFEWWSHNWGGLSLYTFGERMADYMRDKIDQYDIMHDNQTLCYALLDVRDMGLPVVGTIHHPSQWISALILPMPNGRI